eukprot:gene8094-5630_t
MADSTATPVPPSIIGTTASLRGPQSSAQRTLGNANLTAAVAASNAAIAATNGPQLTAAASDFLHLGQLDFDPKLNFITTNRVVAVLQKAVDRLQLLSLLDTTEPSTFSEAKAAEAAKMAETDNIASRMIGTKRTGLTRSACLFAGPQGRALQKTVTAVTNAILAATNTQHRGRATVAEMLADQRQLEIRYGELLRATKKVRPRATDPVVDPTCFSSVKDPEQAALQHELKSISSKLREHNKILCTQLKDNPNDGDNWVKVSNERQELIALLQGTIAELCAGYEESRQGRGNALKSAGSTMSVGSRSQHNVSVSNANNATSVFAASKASNVAGDAAEQKGGGARASPPNVSGTQSQTPPEKDPQPLMKRFGSTMQMKRAKSATNTAPRIPLVSSYESFARKILREQAAQRWADELVKKERELNQNVKQLQSDLLMERSMKEKEISERRATIEELRVQLRELRHRLNERSEEAKEQVEAATEGLQRQAADEDRIVTEEMLHHQQQLDVEQQTFTLFADHLKERAGAMDVLAAEWDKKNQTEIKQVETRKIDAEQTRQATADKLRDYEADMIKQKEMQKERTDTLTEEENAAKKVEETRQAEYVAASQLQSAIKSFFTRNAIAKLKKKGKKGKKKKKGSEEERKKKRSFEGCLLAPLPPSSAAPLFSRSTSRQVLLPFTQQHQRVMMFYRWAMGGVPFVRTAIPLNLSSADTDNIKFIYEAPLFSICHPHPRHPFSLPSFVSFFSVSPFIVNLLFLYHSYAPFFTFLYGVIIFSASFFIFLPFSFSALICRIILIYLFFSTDIYIYRERDPAGNLYCCLLDQGHMAKKVRTSRDSNHHKNSVRRYEQEEKVTRREGKQKTATAQQQQQCTGGSETVDDLDTLVPTIQRLVQGLLPKERQGLDPRAAGLAAFIPPLEKTFQPSPRGKSQSNVPDREATATTEKLRSSNTKPKKRRERDQLGEAALEEEVPERLPPKKRNKREVREREKEGGRTLPSVPQQLMESTSPEEDEEEDRRAAEEVLRRTSVFIQRLRPDQQQHFWQLREVASGEARPSQQKQQQKNKTPRKGGDGGYDLSKGPLLSRQQHARCDDSGDDEEEEDMMSVGSSASSNTSSEPSWITESDDESEEEGEEEEEEEEKPSPPREPLPPSRRGGGLFQKALQDDDVWTQLTHGAQHTHIHIPLHHNHAPPPAPPPPGSMSAIHQLVLPIFIGLQAHLLELGLVVVVSLLAYGLTVFYIPRIAPHLFNKNLYGIDINKTTAAEREALRREKGTKTFQELTPAQRKAFIPESLGIVSGAVYLTCVLFLIILLGVDVEHLSGPLTTITVMLLLGFVDDVLDIRWRYKLLLSAVGCIPLILTYQGGSSVVVPRPVMQLLETWVPKIRMLASQQANPQSPAGGDGGGGGGGARAGSMGWATSLSSLGHAALTYMRDHSSYYCLQPSSSEMGSSFPVSLSLDEGQGPAHIASLTPRHCLVTLGPLYVVYLALLCIFCTNSINILAGVNGVEAGQSIVIAVASILYNLIQYRLDERVPEVLSNSLTNAGDAVLRRSTWISLEERRYMTTHRLYALILLGPFVGVSLGMWRYNKYPSRVFVGDSYTYFSGTVLAVAAIAGLYSKTLMLFFAPQLINFFISLPQLFGFIHCPPHRVPSWNPQGQTLRNSGNYTILNAFLCLAGGEMREPSLTLLTLGFQVLLCAAGFVVRFGIASWLYDHVE